ncbi:MAG: Mrp/NBP35 family ATP-binding protein [Bacillota bacterium]|jgi:Mrp family chromosome partitioning ATPase|nr:Mrp/NBP35 family ATP-binding protein [Bacillota bacterium]
MSEKCDQNCEGCSARGNGEAEEKIDFSAQPHELSNIKNVIGVLSGKGGVGKSIVTSMLAVAMKNMGYNTAILDADITGPSIPKIFGLQGRARGNTKGMFPVKSITGIDVISVNLLLENITDPVVVRGPLIAGTVKQFWTDVMWGDVDFMFIDMPPGTGDVPLTVFQSIAVDGIIVVTSPQELVSMIVSKAVKMAEMMNIPVIGLIENMSYFRCPDNGKDYKIFGESHIDEIAKKHNLRVLAKLPIDPKLSEASDRGTIEFYDNEWIEPVAKILEEMGEMR